MGASDRRAQIWGAHCRTDKLWGHSGSASPESPPCLFDGCVTCVPSQVSFSCIHVMRGHFSNAVEAVRRWCHVVSTELFLVRSLVFSTAGAVDSLMAIDPLAADVGVLAPFVCWQRVLVC